MIAYLVTAEHAYAMNIYLDGMGSRFAQRIAVVPYEQLLSEKRMPRVDGYIFSDLDRLDSGMLAMLGELYQRLREQNPAARLLNHPLHSQQRYELLRDLHIRGINDFNAYRALGPEMPRRYPVLLRQASGFQNSPLALLAGPEALRAEVRRRLRDSANPDDLIVVEYLHTADDIGLLRKYGAFVVGKRIVPRHLFFSRHWMVKEADLHGPDLLAEELAYLESDAHAAELLEICRHAGIDYGRIDYSLFNGRIQIWEINTNPVVMNPPRAGASDARRPVHERFTERFDEAIRAIERDGAAS